MSPASPCKLLIGNAHTELGQRLAGKLSAPALSAEVSAFADGETRIRINAAVRDCTTVILQPLSTPVNEHLITLALLTDAARAAGAARIVAVTPYFAYARQEQRQQDGEARSAQVSAKLLAAVGVDHLIVFDLHARALESAFHFPITHLDPEIVFVERLREWELASPVIVSPDSGGMKRAQRFAAQLGVPMAAVAKIRPRPDMAQALCVLGDVRGRTCVIVDDMASTGRTLVGAAEALLAAGATEVHAVFSHAVLAPEAINRIAESRLKRLLTSDSIPMKSHPRLEVVSIVGAMADAICKVCGGPRD